MANTTNEAIQALQTAIQVESNGLLTYLNFARQTKDEFGKNMFIQLAIDEFEHRQILEKQLIRLLEDEPWQALNIEKSELEQLQPRLNDKSQRIKGKSGLNDVDALNSALELERKAADFFRQKANQTHQPSGKALFQRLAKWEEAHYDIIQAELDSITHAGFWFGLPEFQMDGKF